MSVETSARKRPRSFAGPQGGPATSPKPASPRRRTSSPDRTKPASRPSPTDSTFRANPFPEVTDLICRLPLSTLFYRLEAVHLGDLLRISVRSSTRFNLANLGFQGPLRTLGVQQEPLHFTRTTSLSLGEPLPGSRTLKQKR